MCGIAGIHSLTDGLDAPSLSALKAMAGALRHRGPDESGVYRDRHTGLAHTRLSIIDLSRGQQPLANEDRTIWIVFNGEIYNYVELRRDLIARGHRFVTGSDTEVIVHAYEEWGTDAFSRFNGQWAVALRDTKHERLILSRDRHGVRPLYLCEHAGRVLFASEVKAIFVADPTIPRAFDPSGLDETFTFWSVVPPQSVFQGISELRPGHTRIYEGSRSHDVCYWAAHYPPAAADGTRIGEFSGSPADAAAALRQALDVATHLRMTRADVPVGAYLSGGLDSSLVAALAVHARQDTLRTFSVRFEDTEYDETAFQRTMAAALGSDHHEVLVSRRDIAECFPELITHTERPLLRTAAAPLFLLSRLVSQSGIKVVVTGEGADEMFAGYDLFREAAVRRFWARRPASTMRPRLLERLYPYLSRSPVAQGAIARQFFGQNLADWQRPGFSHAPRWQTTASIKRLFAPDLRQAIAVSDRSNVIDDFLRTLPKDFHRWSFLAQDQYIETRTLLSGYLLSSQGDRVLMAHSVEGRFPFLDVNVVELANSLPPAYKLRGLNEKHVLKRAARGLVEPSVLERKKQPYRAPDAQAFVAADAPEWVQDVVSPSAISEAGVFAPEAVAQLWAKLQARRNAGQYSNVDNMAIVGVLSTQLLHRQFIARAPQSSADLRVTTLVDAVAVTT